MKFYTNNKGDISSLLILLFLLFVDAFGVVHTSRRAIDFPVEINSYKTHFGGHIIKDAKDSIYSFSFFDFGVIKKERKKKGILGPDPIGTHF